MSEYNRARLSIFFIRETRKVVCHMIRLIEALNYRCLRYVRQEMGPFHVLVGPNASGKSTFLDEVAFLGQLVSEGPEAAIRSRSPNPRDLVWNHEGDRFELAIELEIPEELRRAFDEPLDTVRYEVAIGPDSKSKRIGIVGEAIILNNASNSNARESISSPTEIVECSSILTPKTAKNTWFVFYKRDNKAFFSEEAPTRKEQELIYKSAGTKLSENSFLSVFTVSTELDIYEHPFPVSNWLRSFLTNSIQTLSLDSHALRKPSSPGQGITFKPDGANLPLVVENLKENNKDRFRDWINHLRTALPDLEDIEVIDRPEDRHRWLQLCYRGDLRVPSWMVSDGTLRLLALTILSYLPDLQGVFLIEEPENGIHPRAVETMVQSLRSVYGAQVLLATHSPVVLGVAELDEVLCFEKTKDGATDIMLGSEHPALRDWQHDTDLGSLFVAGVLG